MKVTTIARNRRHSPNMTGNDTAILERVKSELVSMGAEVTAIEENEEIESDTDVVCHMTRTTATLGMLQRAEEKGVIVLNPPRAVKACSRKEFTTIFDTAGIPQPEFSIIEDKRQLEKLPYPAWIKNATGWSCHKDDVTFAKNALQAKECFTKMQERGEKSCIHSRHIAGDLIKFYGIGTEFIHCYYPDIDNGKFGLEKINGAPKHHPFDSRLLEETISRAAKAIGTLIYGGDCIVDRNGKVYIIDFNDFPSFSAIRDVAAKEIATLIMNCKRYERGR